jgi:acetyl esterase/lipase
MGAAGRLREIRRGLTAVGLGALLAGCNLVQPGPTRLVALLARPVATTMASPSPSPPGPWPGKGIVADIAYGPDPAQRLDLYEPGPGIHPLIVWIHGGGWVGGSRATLPAPVLDQLSRGFTVVSIDYRLAPAHVFPAAVVDVKRAVRWIKANAVSLRIRPDAIIAWGGSAGGYLAAMVGVSPGRLEPTGLPPELAAEASSVAAVVDMAGPSDLRTFWAEPGMIQGVEQQFLGCDPARPAPAGCGAALEAAATVAAYLGPQAPPAFLAYGTADAFVRIGGQGDRLYRSWSAARGPGAVVYDRVANGGHIYDGAGTDRVALQRFMDLIAAGRLR